MADNFLSNDNYCNKGGLNGKPKATRPEPPKGQLGSKEGIIIDGVNVSECKYFQSSCVPDYSGGYLYKNICRNHGFYDCDKKPCAFKCTEYQTQFKHKEQECEAQRYKLNYYIEKTTQLLDDIDKYKQALDEIEKIISTPCISTINSCIECKHSGCLYRQVLNIINKVNDCK